MPTTGERIKELRIRRNMTQVQLADAVGVSPQVISNIERSYTSDRTKADVLATMASVLGTTTDYLIGTGKYCMTTASGQEEELLSGFRKIGTRRQRLVLDLLKELILDPGEEV